jgi:(1->4)-alpha-D-glucan 1-alpha-D-glucosylmutase
LVGALPFAATERDVPALAPRVTEYLLKASHEAKQRTSWLEPNAAYEEALVRFVEGALGDTEFAARLVRFCRRIDPYAATKALGQVALKLCAPGVPDTYQGAETWHQVLVDPDNRRPVDYAALERELGSLDARRELRSALLPELRASYADGRLKTFVLSELLRRRGLRPELFEGDYVPLDAGPHALAFARGEDRGLVCVVARFPFRATRGRSPWAVGPVWGAQRIADAGLQGAYRCVLSGESLHGHGGLALSEALAHLPVAVLTR